MVKKISLEEFCNIYDIAYNNDTICIREYQDYDNYTIINLNGIEKFKELQRLDISENELINLDGIENCPTLKTLDISYASKLKDISKLKELKKLVYLSIHNCNSLQDYSVFKNLNKLQYLNSGGSKANTNSNLYDNLKYLINIDYLIMSHYKGDLKILSNLQKLNILSCSKSELILNGVELLSNLEKLYISDCNIKTIDELSPLINCKKLKEIYLGKNPVLNDLEPLITNDPQGNLKIIIKNIYKKLHLNKDSELRGKAAAIDSGLFDFKIN